MRTGRPKVELLLTDEERAQLQPFARSRSLPAALSTRARIVLSSADGEFNSAIAARLKLTKGRWHTKGPHQVVYCGSSRALCQLEKPVHSNGANPRNQALMRLEIPAKEPILDGAGVSFLATRQHSADLGAYEPLGRRMAAAAPRASSLASPSKPEVGAV